VVWQNAEHEKTREETSSKHPHKKGAAQAAEGRIRELKSSNATVSPAAAAANNSATATAARQRDNQRALDEKRKERWKSAERSEKREREARSRVWIRGYIDSISESLLTFLLNLERILCGSCQLVQA